MKKITLFILLLISSVGFSQNAPVTFETGEPGSTWTFTTFENGGGLGYEKAANPNAAGINTSATVAKFTALTTAAGAAPWAGCETKHGSDIGTFTLNTSNSTIKIMVWKSVISDVGIKFAIANGGAQPEIKVANTKINEWEELTFDFSGKIGLFETINIDQIIFFPDFQARTTENVCYFDNVTFSAKVNTTPTATGPQVAAPTPPARNAADVKSVFSNAYTDIAGTSWTENWGQTTVSEEVSIVGDATRKYTNLNYQGVVPSAAIDATGMTKLHLDIWTADCTAFDVYLINPGPIEQKVTLTPTLSGWNSFDISLSDYATIALNNVFQFKFVSPNQNSTVYLDNMYFYKAGTVPTPTTAPYAPVTFETGEPGSTWTFTTFENGGGLGYEKVANPNAAGINTSATVAKFTALTTAAGAAPWAGCETKHGSDIGTFTLNTSNSTIKIMVWKSVISDVGIKFAIANGGAQPEIKVANTKINEWEELTFDFSGKIGLFETINIDQIIFFPDFQARTTENVCYFDNVTFSAKVNTTPTATGPQVAAPTPPARNAADVKSVFSNAYADIAGTSWTENWGQTTVSEEVSIVGDATRKYTNLNYQGVVPSAAIDASGMTKLHLDIWTADCTAFDVYLINPGPIEQKVTLTPTLSGWNSFDISLSDYATIALNNVFQFKFVSPNQNSTVYLDNMYFYKAGTVPTPTTAPYAPVTFETGEPGSTWTFTTFENGGGLGYEKVANPNAAGINTSATVAKFTALTTAAGAAPWAGCETKHGSDIGTFTLNTSNSTIKIMVWKSVISDVGIKFAIANGGAQPEIKVANTKINEWEELTFDFSGKIGLFETIDIDQIIFFPDFQARTTENVCYFDNVTFSAKVNTTPTASGPQVAAPTPPARNADDVKSVFSNAYTDIAGTSWTENWGQTTISEEVSIVGDATRKYTNLNYQGVVPSAAIDASGMTKLHLDIWTADCTAFDVYLINPGPIEQKVTLTPTLSGWNSFDISLSDYATIALNNVFQFKFVSPNQNSTVYLDNMYFYKGTSLGLSDFESANFKMYPNPVSNYLTIEANSMIEKISVYNLLGQEVLVGSPKSNATTLQTNNLQKGVYIVKTEIDGKVNVAKIIKE